MSDTLYSVKQVADLTGLKVQQVLRAIKKNRLKASRVGWNWVISESSLQEFQNALAAS